MHSDNLKAQARGQNT